MSWKGFIAVMAVLGVVALLGFGLVKRNEDAIAVGDATPAVELTELNGGAVAELGDYSGRWVLLNFWSSWCDPCRTEAPVLEALQKRHPESLAVVGINLEDVTADAQEFVSEFGLTYPQLRAVDNEEAIDAFGLVGRPENILVDPEGRIALIYRGPVDQDYVAETIEPMLPPPGRAQ
jgi:thiol-disulfide isomerase/thioredoxin